MILWEIHVKRIDTNAQVVHDKGYIASEEMLNQSSLLNIVAIAEIAKDLYNEVRKEAKNAEKNMR